MCFSIDELVKLCCFFFSQNKANTSRSTPAKGKCNKTNKKPPVPKVFPGSKRPSTSCTEREPKRGGKKQKMNIEDEQDEEKVTVKLQRPRNTKRRRVTTKVSYKEESSDGEEVLSDGDEFKPCSEDDSDDSESGAKRSGWNSKAKGKGKVQASQRSSKINKRTKKEEEEEEEDYEVEDEEEEEDEEDGEEEGEEEEEEEEKEIVRKKKQCRRWLIKGDDEWIEVYLKGPKRWICVDVDQGVGHPELCSSQATQPITYVVGVDDHGYLKDVSSRYDPTWLTSSRKRRINSEWWEETLRFYECPDSKLIQEEDKEVQGDINMCTYSRIKRFII